MEKSGHANVSITMLMKHEVNLICWITGFSVSNCCEGCANPDVGVIKPASPVTSILDGDRGPNQPLHVVLGRTSKV